MTVYEMKMKMATVGDQINAVSAELLAKLDDSTVSMEEIEALEQQKADLQKRFDLLKAAHDKALAEQEARIKSQNRLAAAEDEKGRMIAAKATFIRNSVLGLPVSDDVLNQLQAIPAGGESGGDKLLPTTLVQELVHEPFVRNPLREIIQVTAIKGLEIPKIAYEIDDDGFITDADTAKELELEGDKVSFGRFKFKVKTRISDTVLHGSDVELVNYVDNALRSGLAAKEKQVSFDDDPSADFEHMSFYGVGLKEITAEDKFTAIKKAIADLHEDFRDNARVVMSYSDWVDILDKLANQSTTFYQAQPEQILGKPVVFADAATVPIVGDFNYARLNYDIPMIMDSDKDVDKGEYIWVLTGWFDQRILLKSAFRLAVAGS